MVWVREIEYLRGFAALAVIAVHVSMFFTRIPEVSPIAIANAGVYVTTHFAVPIFVFISGCVLAIRYTGAYPLSVYYGRRAWTVLPPYLLFSSLYLAVPSEETLHFAGTSAIATPEALLHTLIMGTAAYHLWFFVLIAQIYLLYPLIIRGYRRFEEGGAVLFLLFALLIIQILWNVSAHALGAIEGVIWYSALIRMFPSHLFYFVAGMYAAGHLGRVKSAVGSLPWAAIIVPVLAGSLLLAGMWGWALVQYGSFSAASPGIFCVYRIIEPFYYITVGIALFRIAGALQETDGWLSGACRRLGEHSFGIYLIHPLILAAAATALFTLTGLGWADWITYPVLFFVTVVASYWAVRLLHCLPGSTVAVGAPRRERVREGMGGLPDEEVIGGGSA
jgi:surface polysaccharide O-acyltransferase-like enzyme